MKHFREVPKNKQKKKKKIRHRFFKNSNTYISCFEIFYNVHNVVYIVLRLKTLFKYFKLYRIQDFHCVDLAVY